MLRDTIVGRDSNLKQEDGVLFYWDVNRGKWVSVFREVFSFTHNHSNISNDIWLRIRDKIPSNLVGYSVTRDSIITTVSARAENPFSATLRYRINGVLTNVVSLTLANEQAKVQNSLNINLDAGDYIQCFMEVNSGDVDYPIVDVEIAARS